ncbi:hypothetical protein, conserved [Leishmania tarentolae]|uniref:BAR domain-containing protein n=1 Tax=Leishmania tarentolae TaxID=5689 RepID=A0A640KGC6_LEITA|nr:hypothetical protein, conserved [Leishmania tarentolae]
MPKARSPSPAKSNCEFALRHERVKLIAKALKQFSVYITRTTEAMREVASCLSLVGKSYHEVAECVNNTNPHCRSNQDSYISFNKQLVESYGANLRNAATLFSSEMMDIKGGEQFLSYNKSMHRTVMARLHDVLKKAQKTRDLGDDVKAELKKTLSWRKIVSSKKEKYIRKGRPLTESKLYVKQSKKMQKHEEAYEAKLRTFDTEYESLMQRQLYVAGHTMDDFLDMNTVYLSHILKVLGCLAPHGAEAIQKMLTSSDKLSDRLGITPENQLGCRLRTQSADVLNSTNMTPVKVGVGATPSKGTPAKSSRCGSSHNFTSYYENRRQAALCDEGAPPTARALDDYCENTELCSTLGGTPQRQLISNQTPLKATFESAEVCKGTSCSYSAVEPFMPTPLQPPSFPSAVRRVDSAPVPYANQVAIGPYASCGTSDMITNAAKQACPAGTVTPAALVTTAGGRRGSARDATNTRTTSERNIDSTHFGRVNAAAGAPPAACLASAPPLSQYSGKKPVVRPSDCLKVSATRASTLGHDRGRSTEPFDDQPDDTGRGTLLMPIKPIPFIPLDIGEGSSSRKTTARTSTATTVVAKSSVQKRPQRDKKKYSTTKVAAASSVRGGVSLRGVASAPPDEDSMSRSSNTQFQKSLGNSLQDCHAAHDRRPRPQKLHNVERRHERDTAPVSLAHFQEELTGCSVNTTCPWRNDGLCSEAGGISGRSPHLSTSYGLNSPTPTPQALAPCTSAWEDTKVQSYSRV